MRQRFVHLRIHSEFSLVDGLVRVKPLMKAIPERAMAAVAVTDYCNLFATVKVYKAALDNGIKPIIGADIPWVESMESEKSFSLVLLCQNDKGYHNLTRLIARAYQEGQFLGKPRVLRDWIQEHSEGLIALSGARDGDIGQALLRDNMTLAREQARFWHATFPGRFYIELQRCGREGEAHYNAKAVELAAKCRLPVVATNDVRFMDSVDFEAHEARVCIGEGRMLADPSRDKSYSEQQYLRSAEEMQALFADLPSALTNTVLISQRCNVQLSLWKNYLPDFPIPAEQTIADYLSSLAKLGLNQRLQQLFPGEDEQSLAQRRMPYDERLAVELAVINRMGFPGYFLIVADFIQWARKNDIPVGPGRGSGAGSLVAYALGITDLDPLAYDLLFERFLNPERVSMPDFDIDFCMEGRDRVIEYVAEKYGRHCVSQIITFGTMAAKAVVRDVGRVLGLPYPVVDKIAKLIPFEIGMTLKKALEQEEELRRRYEEEEEVREHLDLALKLEGITRNAGKHAGGVVIAPSNLTDFTAIYCEQGSSQIVSQFDKDDVEAVGLVKFDFLGLRTLTIIDWAIKTVNARRQLQGEASLAISQIPTDDPTTFRLLKACQTTAVFQLESRGMKELIGRLQPDCFEEIIALVALFRPGPLQSGMVDDFIDRKHGRANVEYPHPDLEPILKPTYGVILYQEQVMQIAQVLANYTLGAADLLRRAMGKKKPEEMAKQREIFTEGARARGVDTEVASYIFDLMEKFAGYGFNKSHSAAYALVSYQTAWLKTHYPAAFMAAVMSADMDNTDKVVIFIDECEQMKLTVCAPDINQSQWQFTVNERDQIVYGLGAIKGVGESAIDSILTERQRAPYSDLFDFCRRVDSRKVNRRVLEALVKSGSFDHWQIDRAILLASIDKAMRLAEKAQARAQSGQIDLFSLLEDDGLQAEQYVSAPSCPERIRLDGEKETLGYYLSGHPAKGYRHELRSLVSAIATLSLATHKKTWLCAQIMSIRKLISKRGKKLAIVSVDDGSGRLDIVVFSEILEQAQELLHNGEILVIEGELSADDYSGGIRMTASGFYSLPMARSRFAQCLRLDFKHEDAALLPRMKAILQASPGDCPVKIAYDNKSARAELSLGKEWLVHPDDNLLQHLRDLLGDERVMFCY
ncbi:MAG: DNA polymerase III subunit alpha [Legionellaceae bacterium]|nr:DNA polymerase III subunit alpha [Legionellaceae bacterium]